LTVFATDTFTNCDARPARFKVTIHHCSVGGRYESSSGASAKRASLARDLYMRSSFRNGLVSCLLVVAVTLTIASCGGGAGGSSPATPSAYTVSGIVSGLGSGQTIVLELNGNNPITVSASGAFSFPTTVGNNDAYSVTVSTHPQAQVCTVANGSASAIVSNITNVQVTCTTQTFTIAGTLAGLTAGSQVAVENNGADLLTLSANGSFSFAAPVAFDGTYSVTVATEPQDATCTVQNGTGSGVTANVSNIVIQCAGSTFTIGGALMGLASGMQVTLDNNSADPLVLSANGFFTFVTPVAEMGAYNVTVGSQPVGQSCSVTNGQGSEVSAAVSNVTVSCSAGTYTIGGSVAGLAAGQQVTLEDNGGDPLTVMANGSFTFEAPVVYGSAYTVTVGTQPTGQVCVVANGSGSAITANVGTVSITCMANTQSFATPGSYTWTVPAGVTSVSIAATGGGGGGGGSLGMAAGASGGAGAVVNSILTVTSGQTLNLTVGGGGIAGTSNTVGVGVGWGGGGGGGSSNIDAGTAHQIIAGGGGGGGGSEGSGASVGASERGGGDAGGVDGTGGNGQDGEFQIPPGPAPGGHGGNGGMGGAGESSSLPGSSGASGGNGSGGAGGTGGSDGSGPTGGAGGSSIGAGTGGSDGTDKLSGGGGGGYGGGGSGAPGGGGGAGGSTGPAGTTYAPAGNGGGSATNGGDGSIVITLED
jgi:hypothetical protein